MRQAELERYSKILIKTISAIDGREKNVEDSEVVVIHAIMC